MPAEIRTPFSRTAAVNVSPGLWRKKVLPVGDVEYKGSILHFTPEYLSGIARAFRDRAYDQVPFQLADAQNMHTNDPERYRGQIIGMEMQPDGLYVKAQLTPEGEKVLRTNPSLGVSARIVEQYQRSDGRYYPAAIQHVLGTLDPRIPGLGAWQSVEMSGGHAPDMIIDLSATTFAGDNPEGGSIMPDLTQDQQSRLAALLELDPDKLSALMSMNPAALDQLGTQPPAPEPVPDEDEIAALIEGMSDEEFAVLAAEYDVAPEPQLAGAGFSNYDPAQIELEMANTRILENERQMAVIQGQLDEQAFLNEKRRLMGTGVPPFIADLARPLLEGTGHVVEMANGQGVDAGQVMRRVLSEFGRAASMLDLSAELGSSMDEPDSSVTAEQRRGEFVRDYRAMVGI